MNIRSLLLASLAAASLMFGGMGVASAAILDDGGGGYATHQFDNHDNMLIDLDGFAGLMPGLGFELIDVDESFLLSSICLTGGGGEPEPEPAPNPPDQPDPPAGDGFVKIDVCAAGIDRYHLRW